MRNFVVPFDIAFRYKARGFKPADALIVVYTEWVEADVLLTDNRHFLNRSKVCLYPLYHIGAGISSGIILIWMTPLSRGW